MSDTTNSGKIDIKKLYEEGISLNKLGKMVGMSTPTLKLRLQKMGVNIRIKVRVSKKRYGYEDYKTSYTDKEVNIEEDCKTAFYK